MMLEVGVDFLLFHKIFRLFSFLFFSYPYIHIYIYDREIPCTFKVYGS